MYYLSYGPYISIAVVLIVLFILWAFWGGQKYEFVGLAPLDPATCSSYTGSIYNWGVGGTSSNNVTPAEPPITVVPPSGITVANNVHDVEQIVTDTIMHIENVPRVSVENIENVPNVSVEILPREVVVEQPCIPDKPLHVQMPNISLIRNQENKKKRKIGTRLKSVGERICCETMEKIYGVPFVTVRPNWLANPETGHNLELDCYNDDLKIAVEYNGIQHYEWPNFTPMTYEEFIDQHRRDRYKKETCDRYGVYLITVPYTVSHNDIPSFIISHLPETIRKRLQNENVKHIFVV